MKLLTDLYPMESLQYKIIYMALCIMALEIEKDGEQAGMAAAWGVTEQEIAHELEELYTNNPDPDREEEDDL
ncbi:hypothetical protein P40081_15190 [Paenibacillus sp. FSL P4-0081]|uniref:hypothetical protein n=1 Tax=Paenibacillus sp. FSL P4-0081 TaxID=1536769 RepID=UPI0004F75526|nr:hypothetical protein [Paenibacillus sp. FSL P4-0081]AIQ29344.1 hypothetical protein P40081_15190 [Paenibacillus sp. FSL P4-0081]